MKSMCQEARRNSPSVTGAQPDLLLHAHDLADRVVLDGAQLLVVEPAVRVRGPRVEQPLRAQQAADVVGAERRRVPRMLSGHLRISSSRSGCSSISPYFSLSSESVSIVSSVSSGCQLGRLIFSAASCGISRVLGEHVADLVRVLGGVLRATSPSPS